jgi:lipopolysaccharide biosynthesis regulator YciM
VLGNLEAERGRSKAALAAWSRVPELDRKSGPLVYPQLEATYAALERARDFEGFLRKLLEKRPDDSGARLALARNLAARGDSDVAIAELHQILHDDPEDLEARSTLGRLLISEHRDAEASKVFGELLDALERREAGPGRRPLE